MREKISSILGAAASTILPGMGVAHSGPLETPYRRRNVERPRRESADIGEALLAGFRAQPRPQTRLVHIRAKIGLILNSK
jgi:hypothetical protein